MIYYVWPTLLTVFPNVVYQICAKSVLEGMNSLASLTVTYFAGAAFSLTLYYLLHQDADIWVEYCRLNWVPLGLGHVIEGLEVGFIYIYRAGWPVSIVQRAFLTVVLLALDALVYQVPVTVNKHVGIALCLAELAMLNG
jgi:hypothetical protein